MNLELGALLGTMSFLIAPLATLFYIDKLRRPPEPSGRYWALMFVAAMLCSVAYFIAGHSDDVWWSVAVGNGAMVLTLGSLWAGCRAFNGRRPLGGLVVVVSVVVTVTSGLPSAGGSKWAGAPEKMAALALLSVLIVLEAFGPRLRTFVGGRVLAGVLGVHAVYVVLRVAAYLTAGPGSTVFETWFSTRFTTAMNLVLVLIGGAAVIGVRVEDARRLLTRRAASGGWQRFERRHRFERAAAKVLGDPAGSAALLVVEIDAFEQLRGAHGIASGKGMRDSLGQAVLATAPPDAVLGREGARYLVLAPGIDAAAARLLAAAVQSSYAGRRPGGDASAVSVGIAVGCSSLESLLGTAATALERDALLEWGRVAVG